MPDFFEFKDPLPSVDEVLFTDADRDDGTETTFIELKGSSATLFRDFKRITTTTTVVATLESGTGVTNIPNMVDKNTDSSGKTSIAGTVVLRFDWGTQATRIINAILGTQFTDQSGDTITVNARFAESDLVFSSYQQVFFVSETNLTKTVFTLPFQSQDLQFVELQIITTGTLSTLPVCNIFEVYDRVEGFGGSDVRVEIQNNITGTWFTAQTFANISGSSNTEIKEGISAVPNGDRARLVLTNNGKWNGSIGVLISRPQTT